MNDGGSIWVKEIGTVSGYEDYHLAVMQGRKEIGTSHWDKRQSKYITLLDGYKKRLYSNSVIGVVKKVEKFTERQKERKA